MSTKAPRHFIHAERLSAATEDRIREHIRRDGWFRTAKRVGTTDTTLQKLILGPGVTLAVRDRLQTSIEAYLDRERETAEATWAFEASEGGAS